LVSISVSGRVGRCQTCEYWTQVSFKFSFLFIFYVKSRIRVKVILWSYYHTLVTSDDMVTVIVTWLKVQETMILYNIYNIYWPYN